jgi:hypothetical protein
MFIKLDLVIRMDFEFYLIFKPLGKSLTHFIKKILHGPDPDRTWADPALAAHPAWAHAGVAPGRADSGPGLSEAAVYRRGMGQFWPSD